MKTLLKFVGGHSLIAEERGLSTVEYVIILVLIAVLGIGAWSQFGDAVKGKIDSSTDDIEDMGQKKRGKSR